MNEISKIVAESEEVFDPLDDLIERTRLDVGLPFDTEILAALASLKLSDRHAFEKMRVGLKEAKCRVTELDKELGASDERGSRQRPTQADNLTGLLEEVDLFAAPDGDCFADIKINGHRETWRIRSGGFEGWLLGRYYQTFNGTPSNDAVSSALNMAEAACRAKGQKRDVCLRVGSAEGKHYVDLCDDAWRAVEIDETGWRIISDSPVRFRRADAMQALPEPERGGSISELKAFLNVSDEDGFVLTVAWLLAALRDSGPYPLLTLSGEQGSAKSTFVALLKALIDPCSAFPRTMSDGDRNLYIHAKNNHVLAFDNLSKLSNGTSDALCRMSTGGGFSVRQLYTDEEEKIFEGMRPMTFNGIEEIITRPDLADRSLFLTLDPIPEEKRRLQSELWAAFTQKHPLILGALLDAMVIGLRRLPEIKLPTLPRMADFATWAVACEPAFASEGMFMAAYKDNRDRAIEDVIEADPVAGAVRKLMLTGSDWRGTATELLVALQPCREQSSNEKDQWPSQPNQLSGALRRAAPFLRKLGISVTDEREGRDRLKIISISTGQVSSEAAADGADDADDQFDTPT